MIHVLATGQHHETDMTIVKVNVSVWPVPLEHEQGLADHLRNAAQDYLRQHKIADPDKPFTNVPLRNKHND